MHETIRTAIRPLACDVCGGLIRTGERYRVVRDEYSPMEYREHIQCPGARTAVVCEPRPAPPKAGTFNPCRCMA